MDPTPTSQETHTHICANTRGTKTDNGNLKDAPLGLRQFLATESL